MHRADREIVERIELAFIENDYKPITGHFVGAYDYERERCGLGALGLRTHFLRWICAEKSAATLSG